MAEQLELKHRSDTCPQHGWFTVPGPSDCTCPDGLTLKNEGMAAADAAASAEWREKVDHYIQMRAIIGIDFTAEDVREVVGDPPSHPNALGARFNAAARKGLIEKVGFREAERASAHRRVLTIWRGVEDG